MIEALFGAAQAFFQPAYSGLLPQTVPEELIQDARALTESMANLAFLIGPALATALVLGIGAGEAFAFDAATFVLSAVLLMRVHPRPRGEAAEPESVLRGAARGLARGPLAHLGVGDDRRVHRRGAVRVRAVVRARAGDRARRLRRRRSVRPARSRGGRRRRLRRACSGSAGGRPVRCSPGMLLVLAWPVQDGVFALGAPLALVVVCAFATGFGFSLLMIWWETALARHIPPRALSRVSAWDWMGSLALLPLGFLLAGPLAAAFGARTVLGVGSAIGLVLLLVGPDRRARRASSATSAQPSSSRARSA